MQMMGWSKRFDGRIFQSNNRCLTFSIMWYNPEKGSSIILINASKLASFFKRFDFSFYANGKNTVLLKEVGFVLVFFH